MLDRNLNNLPLLESINRAHHQELIRRTQQAQLRLLDEAKSIPLTLLDHILIRVGGTLITVGKKLQERYVLVMPHSTKVHPSKY